MAVIRHETIRRTSSDIRPAHDNNNSGPKSHYIIHKVASALHRAKFSIKLRMSFGAELIGFSLAFGTNDVVTGERSIVVTPEQFVRVTQRRTNASTFTDELARYSSSIYVLTTSYYLRLRVYTSWIFFET